MSISFSERPAQTPVRTRTRTRKIPGQAAASVRLATVSDEALLWELGLLHATRSTGTHTDADQQRIVELELEYLRRHPVGEPEPVR